VAKKLQRCSRARFRVARLHARGGARLGGAGRQQSHDGGVGWGGEQGADEPSALVVGASNGNLHVSLESRARL
jgi:hypothetical protein